MDRKKSEMFFIGIGSGLVIGSLLGMLLAPYSGRELRMKLDDMKDDIKDRAQRFKEPEKYGGLFRKLGAVFLFVIKGRGLRVRAVVKRAIVIAHVLEGIVEWTVLRGRLGSSR